MCISQTNLLQVSYKALHTGEELRRIRLAQVRDDRLEILQHLPPNSISAYVLTKQAQEALAGTH